MLRTGKRNKHLVVTCLKCGHLKRFRTDQPSFYKPIFGVTEISNQKKNTKQAPVINGDHIVLFKGESEPDEYRSTLTDYGFKVSRIPMQRMSFVHSDLLEKLMFGEETSQFRTLIVSSLNAVRAIESLDDSDSLAEKIRVMFPITIIF